MNDKKENRGPYKRYLKDDSVPIPASTLRYRRAKQEMEKMKVSSESSNSSVADEIEILSEPANLQNSIYSSSDFSESGDNDSDTDNNSGISEDLQADLDKSSSENDGDYFYNEDPLDSDNGDDCGGAMDIGIAEDIPLYNGCDMNRRESELLIMNFALRHNLTDKALENQIGLIDCHLPYSQYKSKYRFLQSFQYPKYLEYYFCSICSVILPFEFANETAFCEYCETNYNKTKLKELGNYFLYLPLKDQLINLVKSEIYTHFRKINDESDIVNSSIYRQLYENKVIGLNDFTITWNTDGVSLCKSSKFSMWPLQISLNELPYRIRRKNIILCGLFYGNKKPVMNVFLEPFQKELVALSAVGFTTNVFGCEEEINIKVHTILCSVDSVARPLIQNIKQYNGKYGCSYCLQAGEHMAILRGFSRVYPYQKNISKRCQSDHEKHVKLALETKSVVKGVKGPSVMSLVPYHNIIYAYPPEYMHSCLLGITKLFATEWFNSANNGETWCISTKATEFDAKLLAIKPPCEITRTPQSIINNKYKANDWKNFLLYYSLPCLHNLLQHQYWKHWFLFVYSMSIFLKAKISIDDIELASLALRLFVQDTEKLYGRTFMKYNMHILLHLPTFIKNYGALWAWSAFPFEHYNGVLKSLYHGTQYIPQQMCKQYFRLRYVINENSIFNKDSCNSRVKVLVTKLMNECKVKNCIEHGDNLKVFGKPKHVKLSLIEKLEIERTISKKILPEGQKNYRFIYKNVVFHSSEYKRLIKRNNSYVLLEDGSVMKIISLVKVTCTISYDQKYVILGEKMLVLSDNLCKHKNYSSSAFLLQVKKTSSIICYAVSSIARKCVLVPHVNDTFCVIPIGNTFETD